VARPLRVLHVFAGMERGGAELRTLDVIRNIERDRFQFNFCAVYGRPGSLDDEIRSLGGEVHLVPLGVSFPWAFCRLLRKGRYQIVHSHVHLFSGFILRLAAQEGVPVRIAHFRSMHDGQRDNLRRLVQRRLMRYWIGRYATDILAVAEGAMACAWRPDWQSDPRCRVVYSGLDLSGFPESRDPQGVREEFRLPPDCRLLIHVGRMSEAKNHPRLVAVFADLSRLDPSARLLLVGRDANEIGRRVRTQVTEAGLAGRVAFAGERDDVPRLLAAADLMLFPSVREGLPGAVLESCAVGTPVLASDLPGIQEVAARLPNVHCLALASPDSEWADAACGLLAQGGPAKDRRHARQAFADSVFTVQRSAQTHREIWEKAAGMGSADR